MTVKEEFDCVRPVEHLTGKVRVGRKLAMPNYGSLTLEFEEEFVLSQDSHSGIADKLAERLRDKLREWDLAR